MFINNACMNLCYQTYQKRSQALLPLQPQCFHRISPSSDGVLLQISWSLLYTLIYKEQDVEMCAYFKIDAALLMVFLFL